MIHRDLSNWVTFCNFQDSRADTEASSRGRFQEINSKTHSQVSVDDEMKNLEQRTGKYYEN